jgi:hypothetical protein
MTKATEENKSIVETAKERFKAAKEAYEPLRSQFIEDMKFLLGDSDNGWQWPEDTATQRANAGKVVLTVNIAAQHSGQVTNQIRQNRPNVKVHPVDDGADKDTAEMLAGLVRNIQNYSNADDAHDLASEYAVPAGEGYWRILTEYESDRSMNQVPVIKPVIRPDLVFVDPSATELDKSDARWFFVFEDMPKIEAKEEFGLKDEIESWESEPDGWVTEKMVRVAEYFYREDVEGKLYQLEDGSVVDELPEGRTVLKERSVSTASWKWCKLVGNHDEPVDTRDWPGAYMPLVCVVGKELYAGDKLVRKGIVRDLKDQNRMVNYAFSETVQTIALQNKTPYISPIEAVDGLEEFWNHANIDSLSYLPYNAFDDNGNPIPPPQRQAPPVMPVAQVNLLQMSVEQLRAASGQNNTNFGIKSEASSGIGIQRLKQQGEVATFHFPDNLTRALRYEVKVLIDLIQKLYDVPRVVRVLGLDGKEELAKLDPTQQQAFIQQQGADIERIFNPTLGRYDVVIDTGPSFQTLRQEGAAQLNEIAARNPALMEVAGDIVFKAQDFPFADELAERMEKVLPPNLKGEGEQQQLPPQVQQQMQQMQQQMEQMQQYIGQLEQEEQQKIQENMAKQYEIDQKIKLQHYEIDQKMEVERYKAETERIKALAPPPMAPMTPEADLR